MVCKSFHGRLLSGLVFERLSVGEMLTAEHQIKSKVFLSLHSGYKVYKAVIFSNEFVSY